MKRCLTTFDITFLGIGHMIGAGIYVLTGAVVLNTAGSGIVLSFIFAGLASMLSALCYAEFGARVPKAGSAYTYSYITVGEIWAFVIGWNIILEHMLGAAAVARSWSGYLDSLLGHVIRNETITRIGGIDSNMFGDYPDFIAFFVIVIVSIFMGVGAKSSTNFNTIFTIVNVFVIAFIIIYGFTLADTKNWTDPARGGFLPYGFSGVIAGAASCFFAYIGFDSIATSGEEAANPGRSIPVATFISMSIVTVAYVLVSMALTMMVPYNTVHPSAAFSDAFEQRGVMWAKFVVAVGALSGMTTSLVGSLFALPRCVYAMANDGLIFRTLSHIHAKTQVPTLAVVVFGAITAVIALLFDIETLVEFLSIGTLMAYTIVSSSVIILRYRPMSEVGLSSGVDGPNTDGSKTGSGIVADFVGSGDKDSIVDDDLGGFLKSAFYFLKPWLGNYPPGTIVAFAVGAQIVFMLCWATALTHGRVFEGTWWSILLVILFSLLIILCFIVVCLHQQNKASLRFKVRKCRTINFSITASEIELCTPLHSL